MLYSLVFFFTHVITLHWTEIHSFIFEPYHTCFKKFECDKQQNVDLPLVDKAMIVSFSKRLFYLVEIQSGAKLNPTMIWLRWTTLRLTNVKWHALKTVVLILQVQYLLMFWSIGSASPPVALGTHCNATSPVKRRSAPSLWHKARSISTVGPGNEATLGYH